MQEFFQENPPKVLFADGSALRGNELVKMKMTLSLFPRHRIEAWDWAGINIKKESQYSKREMVGQKRTHSVQYRVIENLLLQPFDFIIDDDDSGESADVVTITRHADHLNIEFFHCKYADEEEPGRRIGELYTVCGQAQKSIRWKEDIPGLIAHLLKRDKDRQDAMGVSRLERGTVQDLLEIQEFSKVAQTNLSIAIVQPGLSQTNATDEQRLLLSVTECTLMETYQIPFRVIASP